MDEKDFDLGISSEIFQELKEDNMSSSKSEDKKDYKNAIDLRFVAFEEINKLFKELNKKIIPKKYKDYQLALDKMPAWSDIPDSLYDVWQDSRGEPLDELDNFSGSKQGPLLFLKHVNNYNKIVYNIVR